MAMGAVKRQRLNRNAAKKGRKGKKHMGAKRRSNPCKAAKRGY